MSTPLFRDEAVQHQGAQWLGTIQIARPPSFAWVTSISLILACALAAFAMWGQVTRKARLPGLLVPEGGLIQVTASQTGQVTEWHVAEGSEVFEGQVLARLSLERHITKGEVHALSQIAALQRRTSLEAELRLIEQQSKQRHDAIEDRIRSLAAEERQATAEEISTSQRVQLANQTLKRYQQLAVEGFVSIIQTQQRQEELLDLNSRQSVAQRQLQSLRREQQSLRAEQEANLNAAQTNRQQIQRALLTLDQEMIEADARQTILIKAPKSGHVSAIIIHAGHMVQAGQAVLSLVPVTTSSTGNSANRLEALLFAPTRTSGFVQPGHIVWLRYAAYPYQKFGMKKGTVTRVSETPLNPQELPTTESLGVLNALGSNEPIRRITVKLDEQYIEAYGQRIPLTAGGTLEADVIQEHRAIWEWLFEPILAAQRHIKILSNHPNKTSPGG